MAVASFRYRAIRADGGMASGLVDAADRAAALAKLRSSGVRPIEVDEARQQQDRSAHANTKASKHVSGLMGELAVLLAAGIALDRALALAIGNISDRDAATAFGAVQLRVREGATLSQAMRESGSLFPPVASAMAEAGEASGKLGIALSRVATMLEEEEALRRQVSAAATYPVLLAVVAGAVILLMLLYVVPRFETLFATARGELPAASVMLMSLSRTIRDHGFVLLFATGGVILLIRHMMRQQNLRRAFDRAILDVPQLGTLVRGIETARFARTLGALLEANVSLPVATDLARRTIGNSHISGAIAGVTEDVRQGKGLAQPLIATDVLPPVARGFLRTGEETSQLGPMLERLAVVLDRDVKNRLQRLIAVVTPAITIFLAVTVAGIIAAIMSAILGFNDLAVAQ